MIPFPNIQTVWVVGAIFHTSADGPDEDLTYTGLYLIGA